MAAAFNLAGPLLIGGAVANTIGKIVDVPAGHMVPVIGAGLSGAVAWNLVTWWRGLPASSSHALVGGLVGAALLDSGPTAVSWGPVADGHVAGVLGVLVGLLLAGILGLGVAFILEHLVLRSMRRATVRFRQPVRAAQWVASAWLAFSHGSNDAQKSVGIVAALLLATGRSDHFEAPVAWVVATAVALTLGTALGGWSIVRTIGRRIFPLRSVDGLVSQTSSAGVILAATLVGAPVSTTQVVSSSIVGVGVARGRWRHVSWEVVREIAVAWLTTMPAAGAIAGLTLPAWMLIAGG